MRFYVASKFENKEAVRDVYAKLKARGHVITHDWTQEDASNSSPKYKMQCAVSDFRGVRSADAVIVLNHDRMFGGATEMGMAIAYGIPVYVVNKHVRWNIFFELPTGVFEASNVDNAIFDAESDYDR